MIPHPPQLIGYEVQYSRTLRFIAAAAFNNSINYQNLLDLILFTTSAIAPYDLFKTVRVKCVECWALPAIASATSVTVIFDGQTAGSQGDRRVHTDTSMGIEPAHVKARPDPKSLASNFQLFGTAVAFYLDIPAGCVIDVSLDFKGDAIGSAAVAAQNASVGATVGVIAYRGLDGVAVAGTNFTVPGGIYQI